MLRPVWEILAAAAAETTDKLTWADPIVRLIDSIAGLMTSVGSMLAAGVAVGAARSLRKQGQQRRDGESSGPPGTNGDDRSSE